MTSRASAEFGQDVDFLRQHTAVIVLSDTQGQSQLAVAPAWQGRVMTSTAQGHMGASFGWINRELIASGKLAPHINAFGGEDRLWLGPEGGQFSIYFAPGVPFDLEHWFVPAPLDTEPFKVVGQSHDRADFEAHFTLTNYSGARFEVKLKRTVQLMDKNTLAHDLGVADVTGLDVVAYESRNTLVNAGDKAWSRDSGLLSIWVPGMFNSSPATTIVAPFKQGAPSQLGSPVTSDYFGSIPPDRLKVTDTAVFLKADSAFRSKIGISPQRSRARLGSYDAEHHMLTLVWFDQPDGATDYVNSLWKHQEHPYTGDTVNAYNDGPPAPGARQLGAFFELESSSPAAALSPGASLTHIHRTAHLTGPESTLQSVALTVLGVSLTDIQSATAQSPAR